MGIYSHRYAGEHMDRLSWSWSCRLDCWAELTSEWYLPSQSGAAEGASEHLRVYHMPAECPFPTSCPRRHSQWQTPWSRPGAVERAYPSHLEFWTPVHPSMQEHVTLSA